MDELSKVKRVLKRKDDSAPHEVLAVLDAHVGQNSAAQVKVFAERLGITGLVLAKMDGSARAGVVLAIEADLDVATKLVGIGEALDDLEVFDPSRYLDALLEMEGKE
jgi:fused signal recognition particle receptor